MWISRDASIVSLRYLTHSLAEHHLHHSHYIDEVQVNVNVYEVISYLHGAWITQKLPCKIHIYNKHFQTWPPIGWQHSCRPIRSHVRKSLFIIMDFNWKCNGHIVEYISCIMHTICAFCGMLWLGTGQFYPSISGLRHWHCMGHLVTSIVPADVPAPSRARTSAGTVVTSFASRKYSDKIMNSCCWIYHK